ncbi:MAG: hypothetical protein ACPLRA_01340 [Candidatus Saccharicenans sp.]
MKPEIYKNQNNISSIQGVTGERKGERLLDLSLPALVSGENASGRRFKEKTELTAISSEQATFSLKNPVKIGSQLQLILNVPATPLLIHPLRLEISGQVSLVEINGSRKFNQLVTIRLEKKFRLNPAGMNNIN